MFQQTPQKRVLFPRTLALVMVGGFVVFTLLSAFFALRPQPARAATTSTLSFQARLENTAGNIVPDGFYNVQFKIYSGGTAGGPAGKGQANAGTNLWTETWYDSNGASANNDNRIQVRNGYLSANLGSQNPFSGINWNEELWITMNIGGTTQTATPTWDGEMNPRLKLTGVPYAFSAGQLATTNASNDFTSTLTILQPTVGSQVFQIQDQGAAGTYNLCVQNSAACGFAASSGSTSYIHNQNVSQQASANFWLSGTGRADTALQAPTFDTATAAALNIGTTNATVINLQKDVTVAAGKYISMVGGATNTRPASPTDGMLYYDTTIKQLLVYNTNASNNKWQADRSSSTVIVGTSASGGTSGAVASKVPDGADYVNTSTTSAQTVINAAITSLGSTGGTVYLMEGTYIVDAAISLPNNVTIMGTGDSTVLKLKNSVGSSMGILVNSGSSRITVRDLKLDGNKANNGVTILDGITMVGVGSGTGTTAVPGLTIERVTAEDFVDDGFDLRTMANSIIRNSSALDGSSVGIYLQTVTDILVEGVASRGNIGNGITVLGTSSGVRIVNSVFEGNSQGVSISAGSGFTSVNHLVTGNVVANNSSHGINLQNSSGTVNGITVSGNTIRTSATGIRLNAVSYNTVTGNAITSNTGSGIELLNAIGNDITGNKLYDNGGSTTADGINITTSNTNNISSNDITDTAGAAGAYAIHIVSGTSNYLSDNQYSGTGAASILDAGTTTVYANQINATGQLVNTASGALVTRLQSGSSADLFQAQDSSGNALFKIGSTGTLTVGRSNGASGTTGTIVVANGANNNTVTIASGTTSSSYQLNLPSALGTAGQCLTLASVVSTTGDLGFAACGSGGGANTALSNLASVAINTSLLPASNNTIDAGSAALGFRTGYFATSVQTALVDTISASALNIGTTNATVINLQKDVTVAAGKYISMVGGATNTRPASPTDGMLYYDTTIKQLLVYNTNASNNKWQADRSSSTVIVGTSASGGTSGAVASKVPDGADYVNTSTTSAQTVINAAITSLGSTGGTVYLMEGTYIVDGSISVANNVTLVGASNKSTVIKLKNSTGAVTVPLITNTDQVTGNNITLRDFKIDGNKTNNATGTFSGVDMVNVGSGTGATAVIGVTVQNLVTTENNFNGLKFTALANSSFTDVVSSNNGNDGFTGLTSSSISAVTFDNFSALANTGTGMALNGGTSGATVINSRIEANVGIGINMTVGSGLTNTNNTITGSIIKGNGSIAIQLVSTGGVSGNHTITGNIIANNSSRGINFSSSHDNAITGNQITGSGSDGIRLTSSNKNTISGNRIHDSAGTGGSDGINFITSDENLITNNIITDTAGTGSAIEVTSGTRNYLSGNQYSGTGATAIVDTGTTTIYDNQINATGQLVNTASGALVTRLQSGSSADLFQAQDSSGNALFKIGSTGTLTVGRSNGASGTTGTIVMANGANNNTVTLNSGTTSTSYSLTLPTAGIVGASCLKSTAGSTATVTALEFGTCATGSVDTLQSSYTASTNPEIVLDSTRGALTVRNDATNSISANLFEIQNNAGTATFLGVTTTAATLQDTAGNNVLQLDSTNSILKVFENVSSPTNYASISYASGKAVFAASSGTTQIGSGSGNITANLTGATDSYSFAKTYTPSGAYSLTDFTIQRALTGAALSLTGSVLKIEDASTGSNAAPNVLLVNQNNTSATGNLILAQTGGSTTRFSVTTGGVVNASGGYQFNGTNGSTTTCSSGNVLINAVVQGGIVTGGSCAANGSGSAGTLQDAYTNSTSPATMNLNTSGKDFVINSTDLATDPNVIINLQCVTCSASGGRFAIQDAGSDIFLVNPDGSIRIGDATNNMSFSASTREATLNGSARHTRRISLIPEFPGATMTPDGTNNTGTMTSDFCSGTSRLSLNTTICGTNEEYNYYSWTTTQVADQDYDIYIRYQMPSDFSGFASSSSITGSGWRTDGTTNTVSVTMFNAAGTACQASTNVATGTAVWTETALTNDETSLAACTAIAANDVVIFRLKLTASTNEFARMGNIKFDYLSKW